MSEDTKELPKYLSFGELIIFCGGEFTDNSIGAATPQIINEFGYEMIFKPEDAPGNYCLIFLKNGNFIVVLAKDTENGKLYCIRDCHEKDQYDFNSFDGIKSHLNEKYQFNELTIVDGYLIEEFGNIEYLIIDHPFSIINLDPNLCNDGNESNSSESQESDSGFSSLPPLNNPIYIQTGGENEQIHMSLDEMIAMQLQYGEE